MRRICSAACGGADGVRRGELCYGLAEPRLHLCDFAAVESSCQVRSLSIPLCLVSELVQQVQSLRCIACSDAKCQAASLPWQAHTSCVYRSHHRTRLPVIPSSLGFLKHAPYCWRTGFVEGSLKICLIIEGMQGAELIECGRIHCAAHSQSKFEVCR